jgi:O-antigen/teichoic acid export membrane protein
MTDFEVGLYNAALPTAALILLPHRAIGSLALSSFSELKERDSKSIQASMQTATRWVFSFVFPTFLILLLFSEQALLILFGSQYGAASAALSVLAIGYLFDALAGRVGSFLQSEGYTQYILYNNIASLVLNLALNIVLIPVYGIIGAAIATASSYALTNMLMFLEAWRKEGVISVPYREILKIFVTGLLPLAVITVLDRFLFVNTPYWFLIPAAVIYGLLYAVIYLKILGLGEEEKEVFLRIGEITGHREEVKWLLEKVEELV